MNPAPAPPGDPFSDPFRDTVYAVENAASPDGGRRFRRFAALESYVESVTTGVWWEQSFPAAPIEVDVIRRSRGATFSAAHVSADGDSAVVWIRDGSWDAVTVVHELAHIASVGPASVGRASLGRAGAGAGDPTGAHGCEFATALLQLWRELLGVHAYGALRSGLDDHGVPYRRERLG